MRRAVTSTLSGTSPTRCVRSVGEKRMNIFSERENTRVENTRNKSKVTCRVRKRESRKATTVVVATLYALGFRQPHATHITCIMNATRP